MPYGNLEATFNTRKLMQGDPNSVADYALKVSQTGAATVNEVREIIDLDPVEDGDMTPTQVAQEIADKAAEQEAAKADESNNEKPAKKEDKDAS